MITVKDITSGDDFGLEHYLTENGIDDADKKQAILLSVIGPKVYRVLQNLVAPVKPREKTMAELIEVLQTHFSPKLSITVQMFRFNSRTRQKGESVAQFTAKLQRLAEYCKLGTFLNDMLRDRLIVGISNDRIQRRLLAEKT